MTHFAQSVSSLAGLFFGDDEDRAEVHEWQGGRNPARSTMPATFEHSGDSLLKSLHHHRRADGSGPGDSTTIFFEGREVEQCFLCILKVPGFASKRKLLDILFKDGDILAGRGRHHVTQYVIVTSIHFVTECFKRCSYDILNNEFATNLDFHKFLQSCQVFRFLAGVLSLKTPKVDPEDFNPVWRCTAFHAIAIINDMLAVEEAPTIETLKDLTRLANVAELSGLVELLLKCIRSDQPDVVESLWACAALKRLCCYSNSVVYNVLEQGGANVLGHYFMPGEYEKVLARMHDTGAFDEHTRRLLSSLDGLGSEWESCEMSSSEVYRRALSQGPLMQESAGASLLLILQKCKEVRPSLFSEQGSIILSATFRWLLMPPMKDGDLGPTVYAGYILLQTLTGTVEMTTKLIEKCNVFEVLENWLYPTFCQPTEQILECYLQILEQGGLPRAQLLSREHFVTAVAPFVCCVNPTLQETALRILVTAIRSQPSTLRMLLASHSFGPDMLKRAPRLSPASIHLVDKLQRSCRKAAPSLWMERRTALICHYLGDDSGQIAQLRSLSRDALRLLGKGFFAEEQYEMAAQHYSAGLLVARDLPDSMDEMDAVLFSNRAECYLRLERYDDAVCDSSLAIGFFLKNDEVHREEITPPAPMLLMKCVFRRAKAFMRQSRYFAALNDAVFCTKNQGSETRFVELRDSALSQLEKVRRSEGHKTSARPRHRTCTGCGVEASGMKKCSRCEKAFFCSKSCLKENWPQHQKVCQK